MSTHWERVTEPWGEASGMTPESVMEELVAGDAYDFMRGEFEGAEFHRRMERRFGLGMEPDRFFDLWNSIIAPNESVNGLIERLKGRYRLSVGSNTDPLHYARCLEVQNALGHFDDALLSYELGACKPDPAFFRSGLEKLSTPPEECLFIDDREDNVEAAKSLGITGIQFLSTEQLESELGRLGLL